MEQLKITVVGTVRNVAGQIEKETKAFMQVLATFGLVNFFLVESDSIDDTKHKLENLAKKYKYFSFKSLGQLELIIPNRIERLIFCRNVYVNEIRNSKVLRESDYVFVADFDGINNRLDAESIKNSLSRKEHWDVLCSNQKGKYYDLLALRHKNWCPQNVFDEYLWLQGLLNWRKAKKHAIYDKMIRIPRDFGLISVDSAFGGLAIYKTHHLILHDYTRMPRDNQSDIDHVILNRRIKESGGLIYIDSQLINAGWTKHALSSFLFFRSLAIIKKKFTRLVRVNMITKKLSLFLKSP